MDSYTISDYVLNKKAAGIVYRSIAEGRIWEITQDDCLAENPGMTADDFLRLKKISDGIYFRQDRATCAQTKKNISIHLLENYIESDDMPLDEMYVEKLEMVNATRVIGRLKRGDDGLTDMQRKRFFQYAFEGLNARRIAKLEGSNYIPIHRSIVVAKIKVKKLLENDG